MAAIAVSHVAQSLLPKSMAVLGSAAAASCAVDFSAASPDPAMWLLVCFRTLGAWGNTVFVICSAWFLCASGRARPDKAVRLVLDTLAVSLAVLAAALLLGVRPSAKDVAKCFLPTTFANNWFVTCYLLLYAIHPALNWVCEKAGKRGHAALAAALFCLYMLLPAAHGGHFFVSELMVMVAEYVLVAYGRRHLPKTLGSRRFAWAAFAVGTLGSVALVAALELAGLRVGALAGKMLHFDKDGDPLLFASALGLFCLVRARSFVSPRVSRAASLMLLVYLIHENLIVRGYVRPAVWQWIQGAAGYGLLVVWVLLFSLALFLISLLGAWLYRRTLGRAVALAVPRAEAAVRRVGGAFLDWVCELG